jgi:hypothetical protein
VSPAAARVLAAGTRGGDAGRQQRRARAAGGACWGTCRAAGYRSTAPSPPAGAASLPRPGLRVRTIRNLSSATVARSVSPRDLSQAVNGRERGGAAQATASPATGEPLDRDRDVVDRGPVRMTEIPNASGRARGRPRRERPRPARSGGGPDTRDRTPGPPPAGPADTSSARRRASRRERARAPEGRRCRDQRVVWMQEWGASVARLYYPPGTSHANPRHERPMNDDSRPSANPRSSAADPHAGARALHAGDPLHEASAAVLLVHGRGGSAEGMLDLPGRSGTGASRGSRPRPPTAPGIHTRSWLRSSRTSPGCRRRWFLDRLLARAGEAGPAGTGRACRLQPGRVPVGGVRGPPRASLRRARPLSAA